MRDVCHSSLFYELIIRFISSPLPSGLFKAHFTGLWGLGPNKARNTRTHARRHTHTYKKGQLNSVSLETNATTKG